MKAGPGKVRILGGSLRGSVLRVADTPDLRPTPARVRETLFNWLQPVLAGARCLDLFAGTGALGIEALSRGADEVVFVERGRTAARSLEANLQRLGCRGFRVHNVAAGDFLNGPPLPFDVVFLDPPFAAGLWSAVAQRLEQGGWLGDHAWVHVESPRSIEPRLPANWQVHRQAHAGEVRHVLYRRDKAVRLD